MTGAAFRPLLTVVRIAPDESDVTVALDQDGLYTEGSAAVGEGGLLLAAAAATCAAVNLLLPPRVEVGVAWIDQRDAEADRPGLVNACVRIDDGERGEDLLGSAFVRTDAQVAVVRAVLDAMPRRVARYLQA